MKYLKIFLTYAVVLVLAALATACVLTAIINMSIMWFIATILIIALAVTFLCWAMDHI